MATIVPVLFLGLAGYRSLAGLLIGGFFLGLAGYRSLAGLLFGGFFLGLAGYRSLAGLLIGGFFLGLAGTSLGVGVPFVNAWFPPEQRGLAIGIFGIGMGGTAMRGRVETMPQVSSGGAAGAVCSCAESWPRRRCQCPTGR